MEETIFSTISSISALLSVIGMWMIFQYNGETPWKVFIPFYSTYLFSKTFNEERLGKILAWCQFLLVLAVIFFFGTFIVLLFETTIHPLGGYNNNYLSLSSEQFLFACSLIFLFIILVITFIFHIKLHYRYTIFRGLPMWFMLIWIFASGIGYFYIGYKDAQSDNYND